MEKTSNIFNLVFVQKLVYRGGKHMRTCKYIIGICAMVALAVVIFVGCGVDSGARDGNTPGYTGTPGLPGGVSNPGSNPDSAGDEERKVFELVNEEREKAGVSPLEWCDGLAALAKAHSCDMCDRGFFDHTNPDGEGPSDRGRLGHAGSYTFQSIVPSPYSWGIAENIAMGQTTPAQVMNAWMNSSGHRANILNTSYTHIGVGLCDGCHTHWTQNFGTR